MKYIFSITLIAVGMLLQFDTSGAVSMGREPVKIFSLLSPDKDVKEELPELNDPLVYGLSWRFRWKSIEPEPGQYKWAPIDQAVEMTRKAGKKVLLRVVAGMHTPEWVYRAGAKAFDFSSKDLANPEGYPTSMRMPLPWDGVYLAKWEAFIQAFGNRYNGNPQLYSVGMTGGGYIFEMNLPKAFEKWRQAGYADEKLIAAWKRIIDTYQKAFPDTPTNLDINEPLGSLQYSNVLDPIVSYTMATYPHKVYLQHDGLRADSPQDSRIRRILREAAGKTVVGYQLLGGKGHRESETGDRLATFKHALEDNVGYVEVYALDVRDARLKRALQLLGGLSERR